MLYGASPLWLSVDYWWFWQPQPNSIYYEEITKWGLVPHPDTAEWINIFFRHMVNCISGDYGHSFLSNRTVSYELSSRIPNTVLLVITSLFISLFIGSWLVSYQEGDERGKKSWKGQVLSYLSSSTPIQWLGMMFLFAFGYSLPEIIGVGFPQFGTVAYETWEVARISSIGGIIMFVDILYHLALPLTTLVIIGSLFVYSVFKEYLTNNMTKDYLIFQDEQGFNSQYVFFSNLRCVLGHVKTWIPVFLCSVLLVEVVFTWRGIFRYLFDSLLRMDYPVIRGIFITMSTFVIAIQFVLDAAFYFLIRFEPTISKHEKYEILRVPN